MEPGAGEEAVSALGSPEGVVALEARTGSAPPSATLEGWRKGRFFFSAETLFLLFLSGIVEELSSLKESLQSFVSSLPQGGRARDEESGEGVGAAWGTLRNQRDGRVMRLTGEVVTIGRSARCSVLVEDSLVPSLLARLRAGSDGSPVIECLAGAMSLNDIPLRKLVRMPLRHRDQIAFAGNEQHVFAFSSGSPPALIPIVPSSGSSSSSSSSSAAAAAAPTASSSSSSSFPPSLVSEHGRKRNRPFPDDFTRSAEGESDLIDYLLRADNGSASAATAAAPPLTAVTAAAPAVLKEGAAEEQRVRSDQLRREFSAMVVRPADNASIFDSFPYHVAEPTKQIFLNSVAVFLTRPELAPFTKGLSVSPGLVLEGPFGTELIQTELVMAVAKHLNSSVLVVDSPHSILFPDPEHTAAAEDEPSSREGLFGGLLRSKLSAFNSSSRAGGGSASSSAAAMAAAATASSKKNRLRKGDRVRFFGDASSAPVPPPSTASPKGPSAGMVGEIVVTFDEENRGTVGVRFDDSVPGGVSFGGICEEGYGYFCQASSLRAEADDFEAQELEGMAIDAIVAVATENAPCIICIRDIEGVAFSSYTRYKKLQRALQKLPPRVVVVGLRPTTADRSSRGGGERGSGSGRSASSLLDFSFLDHVRPSRGGGRSSSSTGGGGGTGEGDELMHNERAAKMLSKLLPTRVSMTAPIKNPDLTEWKRAVEEDTRLIKLRNNRAQLKMLLKKRKIDLNVDGISAVLLQNEMFSVPSLEQALGWAVGHYARSAENLANSNIANAEVLSLKVASMEHALNLSRELEEHAQGNQAMAIKNVATENEFERKILADVIPSNELNVTFAEIGALDSVKNTLRELVLLPLTRPELFRKGNLTKPSKGVLLFGPPGTGKTMLAKAVATECKANFINVSMASIGSKWFGEGEKYAQAIFTLASKISPSVIFIDEVDSILGKRGSNNNEHEAMRKIKNTIMSMWDGLTTNDQERVIVLAATNRPFDLDDAVLRRLPRRMLVDLPDAAQREQILRVICSKEEMQPAFDFGELAKQTEGYSGSDLRNLCVAAAYIPVREILEEERKMGLDPHKPSLPGAEALPIRALCVKDFLAAKDQISSSVSEDCQSVSELRQWNSIYGEGGDRKKISLSYFM